MNEAPVCLVAGVGPGIGVAVAGRFAREGFRVALLARRQAELDGYRAEIAAAGGTAACYAVDLTDRRAIADTIGKVTTELGDIAVLVYNAAIWREADPMTMSLEAFSADLELCVTGALACAQAVYPSMKARGSGSMLFTGGGLALRPEFGATVPSLTAGKSALRGLTLAMAPPLRRHGIHVATVTVAGAVAPGTAFDPARIADAFWRVHGQDSAAWEHEVVFSGFG